MMNNKSTILLVEDDHILAFVEQSALKKYGYSVHHVTNGEEAVHIIENNSHPIDLILMDIDLGDGIDGTQAAEQILKIKDIPVVFLSSHTEPEVVEKTEKITSYGYVVKNTGIVVLDASIKMALKLFNEKVERLRVEDELRIFSLAVEESSDAIGMSTPDGKHYYQNRMFDKLFGEVSSDPSKSRYKDLKVRNKIFETIKSGKKTSGEIKMIGLDGKELDILLRAYPIIDKSDKIIGLVGVHTDISDSKKAERALRDSEEKNRRLVQNLHAGVVVHDADTNILMSNDRASELLGLSLDQMMGKAAIDPAWKFLRVDKSSMPLDEFPVNQVLAKRAPLRDQVVGIHRPISKDLVWVQISAFPEFDAANEIVQVVVTFVDITERIHIEEKLRESNSA